MKKLFTILFCMFCMAAGAEEIVLALLQPRIAEGSEQCKPMEINMVRGELRKAFGWQADIRVLTRTDVDAMLEEHGFQRSGFVNDKQRKEVGVMTGAQYICVSTITKDGTQLYIEAYLVDIETGQMTNPATQFVNITNNDYSTLKEPCNQLAKEMLGEIGGTKRTAVVPTNTPSSAAKARPNDAGPLTRDGKLYFYKGQPMTQKEMAAFVQANCARAYQYYKKSHNMEIGGWVLLGTAVALVGTGSGLLAAASNQDIYEKGMPLQAGALTSYGIGAISGLVGIPLICVGASHKKNTHKVYNTWCGAQDKTAGNGLELKLCSGANGLGVALAF